MWKVTAIGIRLSAPVGNPFNNCAGDVKSYVKIVHAAFIYWKLLPDSSSGRIGFRANRPRDRSFDCSFLI